MVGCEPVEVGVLQALHRGEDMVEVLWAGAVYPHLAERMIAQSLPECCSTLLEDLAAMGNEEETRPRQFRSQPGVKDGGHHGLAGAGRGDQQIAVMSLKPRDLDQLEQAFLERFRANLDRAEDGHVALVGAADSIERFLELVLDVLDEV